MSHRMTRYFKDATQQIIAYNDSPDIGFNARERKDKVLNRVRAMRGGKSNDPNFGSRMFLGQTMSELMTP